MAAAIPCRMFPAGAICNHDPNCPLPNRNFCPLGSSLHPLLLELDKMSQSYAYMCHCARCAAIGAEPLTYLQFITLLDEVQS